MAQKRVSRRLYVWLKCDTPEKKHCVISIKMVPVVEDGIALGDN